MNKNVIIILLLFSIFACNQTESFQITDLSVKKEFLLKPESDKNYSIRLEFKGNVNGKSSISLESNSSGFKKELEVSGEIDTVFNFDWYQEKGKIVYEPIEVNSGELWIKYTFYD